MGSKRNLAEKLNTSKPCKKCGSEEMVLEYFCHPHSGMAFAHLYCSKCGKRTRTVWAQDRDGPTDVIEVVVDEAIRRWNRSGKPSELYKRFKFKPRTK